MNMDERQELLEIYKLHAGLADSVSRQRGTTKPFLSFTYVRFICALSNAFTIPKWSTAWQSDDRIRTIGYVTCSRMVYPHPFLPPTKFW